MNMEQVKACEFDILCAFADFCDKHNLIYYLTYGTLIGAVRHGGFIPWDDDVDVMMLRTDYNRLSELLKNEKVRSDLDWITIENGKWNEPVGKLVNSNTVGYRRGNYETGLWVDVFPLDNSDEETLRKNIYWRRVHIAKCTDHFGFDKKSLIKFGLKCLYFWKSLDSISRGINERTISIPYNGNISNMVWTSFGKDVGPGSRFEGYALVKFEGREFKTIKDYDTYLRQIYGDYMKLPPENKRRSHGVEAYWKGEGECPYKLSI